MNPLETNSLILIDFRRISFLLFLCFSYPANANDLVRLRYNHPDLSVDLGVGLWAWPLPMDFDQDGDLDLLVSCPDTPFNGLYFFENPDGSQFPIFEPAQRISKGQRNVRVSFVDSKPRILGPNIEYSSIYKQGLDTTKSLGLKADFHQRIGKHSNKIRANQWSYLDIDDDGDQDLIVGIGDWSDYGWDNAYNQEGEWTHGPLHGFVYQMENIGSDTAPQYSNPQKLLAGGRPIDVYGWPSPCFADFDRDGDFDLLCGEFLDGFTYFENIGVKTEPRFASGRRLTRGATEIRMNLQMIVPVAIDWDGDEDVDLIVGDEDGRVALMEHTGKVIDRMPQFADPKYFQQKADLVKCGALATPVAYDWDADGDIDILSGNTAGYIEFFENLESEKNRLPIWNRPKRLSTTDGDTIRIQAGSNGSIQGPCEAKWGYTTISVADWNHDGLPDILANSIWGKVVWYQNVGSQTSPRLSPAAPVRIHSNGQTVKPDWNWWTPERNEFCTQWRTTPAVVDLDKDQLNDIVMLDHEGYLAFFRRIRQDNKLTLQNGKRIFVDENKKPIRLNNRDAGGSGRRKICVVDWDEDGDLDVLANSKNADLYENIGSTNGMIILKNRGPLADRWISSHTTSPTVVDWNRDSVPDLLIGAEDGHFYFMQRKPRL